VRLRYLQRFTVVHVSFPTTAVHRFAGFLPRSLGFVSRLVGLVGFRWFYSLVRTPFVLHCCRLFSLVSGLHVSCHGYGYGYCWFLTVGYVRLFYRCVGWFTLFTTFCGWLVPLRLVGCRFCVAVSFVRVTHIYTLVAGCGSVTGYGCRRCYVTLAVGLRLRFTVTLPFWFAVGWVTRTVCVAGCARCTVVLLRVGFWLRGWFAVTHLVGYF